VKLWVKYFLLCLSVIVTFTGVVGTRYAILPGNSFKLAIIACIPLTLFAIVLLHRMERARFVQQNLHIIFDRLLEKVEVDKIYQLIEIVGYFGMQDDVADTIGKMICTKPDPTERCWLYIALGMIGGKRSESILDDKIYTDENEFARKGIEEAKELLRESKKPFEKWHRQSPISVNLS